LSLKHTIIRVLPGLAVPVLLLIVAHLLVPRLSQLPDSLAGLRFYGAYIMLGVGGLISMAFNRGRVLLALVSLAVAYVCHQALFDNGLIDFPSRTVFAGLCLFVPLNLAILGVLKERGAFKTRTLWRSALYLLEVGLVAWILYAGLKQVTTHAYAPLFGTLSLIASPIPQLGQAMMALALAVTLAAWAKTRSAIDLGLSGAIAAFATAAHGVAVPDRFAMFIAAGALILIIALLQDAFRMAFRDELTGIPGRRALAESMAGLGRQYTAAMVDVDHFKKFNDTYGHDVGDQVLKMVAGKIAHVGGGGKAFRYGGEEFTVLFAGKSPGEAIPHLEELRLAIAAYKLDLRAPDRPAQEKFGKKLRGARQSTKKISVTVSIGVAAKNDKLANPDAVIKAADKALYRAKNKGRNQVCR
jgi:diguanylate cyclase (GGDEF)-like protein